MCNIKINGEKIEIKKYVYLLLNKPKGYISSTEKSSESTVLDLVPEKYKNRNLRFFSISKRLNPKRYILHLMKRSLTTDCAKPLSIHCIVYLTLQ